MSKKSFKGGIDNILGLEQEHPKNEKQKTNNNKSLSTHLVITSDKLHKIKAIAYWDRRTLKSIIDESLSLYIEEYEKKHGEIKEIT